MRRTLHQLARPVLLLRVWRPQPRPFTVGGLMPNQPKTPGRLIRVDEALWRAAQDAAAANDETVSDVVRRALRNYVKRHARPPA